MTTTVQDTLQNGYETLLLGYAAGTLDEAQDLIVASHLTFSAKARAFVNRCEAVGGALIENECEPVAMKDGALNSVLSQLDRMTDKIAQPNTPETPLGFEIPTPIKNSLTAQSIEWKTLFPGMKACDLDLSCKESVARFMKAEPGLKSPHHSHGGMEITLVLDGSFHDETGDYERGDLIVTDDSLHHTPVACVKRGCTCLVVSTAPIKLTGIASMLNPFLKT